MDGELLIVFVQQGVLDAIVVSQVASVNDDKFSRSPDRLVFRYRGGNGRESRGTTTEASKNSENVSSGSSVS